ncbi:MAG: hypothetical protein JWR45_303 [Blastococcus sp.]|jgi:hypothetical protein|nr:hypothetical protein [Blastococcus sp.]
MNDDHGDQFPGALPALGSADTARNAGADERMVRMHAAYAQKANSLVQAGREDLAHELSQTFVDEAAGQHAEPVPPRRAAGRRTPTRGRSGRRPEADSRLGRMGRITRSSLNRFDRYTLEVFNSGSPYRSDRSA